MISSTQSFQVDDDRWLNQIRRAFEEEEEDCDTISDEVPISIAVVPKSFYGDKAELYVPQLIALGPYHHRRPELHDAERYKISAAKRARSRLPELNFLRLVDVFCKLECPIRAHYQRYLDYSGEALAWMMAMDACFLLEFLHSYSNSGHGASSGYATTACRRLDISNNVILRGDVLMLENQIPLFLLRKILELQFSSTKMADEVLTSMLKGFMKTSSPLKKDKDADEDEEEDEESLQSSHLLAAMYYSMVPKNQPPCDAEHHEAEEPQQQHSCCICCVRYLLKIIEFATVAILNVLSKLPILAILRASIDQIYLNMHPKRDPPPPMEEISIPSVAELDAVGVTFVPTNGDLSSIDFDPSTARFHLPTLNLHLHSETVLKNLVAFEATVVSESMVLARYVDMMNGIIDTENDARILSERGVLINMMKSHGDAARLWNGMSRGTRSMRVREIDRVIEDVNEYYESRWKVKVRRFLSNSWWFCSWSPLAFVALVLVLIVLSLEFFCLVFGCVSR